MELLNGKVAIITGATSGIGKASAQLFAREGASVVLGGRRKDLLAQVVRDIELDGGAAIGVAGDVKLEAYAAELVETAVRHYGRLDIGFNNAGEIGEMVPVTELEASAWENTLKVNLTGSFFGAKHQINAMLEAKIEGSILFTSSFVGHSIGFPGMAAYAASKAGLIGMTQCLAVEHGASGIRVNALLPGGTKTAMAGDFSGDPEAEQTISNFHALKRMASADEIAAAALFLASSQSSFVTGSAMLVDGGNSIVKA